MEIGFLLLLIMLNGVFAMSDKGLREVPNPSAIFLSGSQGPTPGSVVMGRACSHHSSPD